jgi:hypothetical protein
MSYKTGAKKPGSGQFDLSRVFHFLVLTKRNEGSENEHDLDLLLIFALIIYTSYFLYLKQALVLDSQLHMHEQRRLL